MIETPRLILRGWRDADYEPWAALNADPEVMRYFPSLLTRQESDATADRIRGYIDDHGWGLWAVERKQDGAFMGFTGLQRPRAPHPLQDDVEVGWRLARWSWGHGYATEAALASLDFGFNELGLSRIVSFTIAENERSQAVMRRLGMTRAPALDFEHPAIPEGHPMRPHVTYVISRLDRSSAPRL